MARKVDHLNIANSPELLRLVDAVRNAGRPVVLEYDNEEVAIISPIVRRAKRAVRGRPVTDDDPLWKLVGAGESSEPTDIAKEKRRYLAELYGDLRFARASLPNAGDCLRPASSSPK